MLLRASTRLRDAGIAIDTHGELDSLEAEAAHAGERDIELARTCPLGPLEQIGVLLGKVALCRVLGRDEAGLELSAEAVRYLRQHLPAAGALAAVDRPAGLPAESLFLPQRGAQSAAAAPARGGFRVRRRGPRPAAPP